MYKEYLAVFVIVLDTIAIKGDPHTNQNYETQLIERLLDGYNRQARPVRDLSQPVNVSIAMHLSKVLDLDERSEILTTYIWLDVRWVDELLQWNESDYGNITSVTLLPTQVWLPDFGITNTADRIYYEDHMRFFRVSLFSSGRIMWHPGGIYKTSCPLTVTYFPFDSQRCYFQLLNWEYDGYEQMVYSSNPEVIPDSSYRDNGEWKLADSYACSGVEVFPDEGPLGYANFYLLLERKSRYSIINVLIPIILLSLMDLLMFWLPPESGEKVSLGITVLLSFSVFLLVVDERMPRTSDTVPILTIYLSAVMATTGVSLFLTVFILHLNYKSHNAPVPRWLKFLLFMRGNQTKIHEKEETTMVNTISEVFVNNNAKVPERNGEKNNSSKVETLITKDSWDAEWKAVVKRIDTAFFLLFLLIFVLLLLIMVYPHDTSVTLDKTTCTFTA